MATGSLTVSARGGSLTILSPAKLNRFLHIVGRRPDGFHLLQTVFEIIDWYDHLTVEATTDGRVERIDGPQDIGPDQDLCVRAAKRLQRLAPDRGCRIRLAKSIPQGAGLGGGSGNAAMVLRTLNELWGLNLDATALADIGTQLGADVPVFVRGVSAWAEGIGERLTPLPFTSRRYLVVIPGISTPTAPMFAHPDLPRSTAPMTIAAYLSGAPTQNDFETLACRLYPGIAEARMFLSPLGPTRLTGSGSALFVENPPAHVNAFMAGAPLNWQWKVCNSMQIPFDSVYGLPPELRAS